MGLQDEGMASGEKPSPRPNGQSASRRQSIRASMKRLGRLIPALLVALLPSRIKVLWYRLGLGYQVDPDVKLGFSLFVGVRRCRIGKGTRIGSLNVFIDIDDLQIGQHVQIGFLNLFRGGKKIEIRDYATVLRLNVINAIPEAEVVNPIDPVFELGCGSVITSGHWLDFTDRITIGDHTVIGGRNSSFWTHNRQRTRPIVIGHHCYLGSEVRVAPGVVIPSFCIVALGAVLMDRFEREFSLIAGNPARVIRPLGERDLFLVTYRTRKDIPEEVAARRLPPELRERVKKAETEMPFPTSGGPDG